MQVFVFDSVGRTIPTLVDALPGAPIYPLPSGGGVQRIASDSLQKLAGGTDIQRTTDPQALTALAVLNYRETTRFDPLTGRPLLFDEHGAATVEHDQGAVQVFPRINPAVIGLITLAGTERILLGKNVNHPHYSLIAGYVDLGETLEAAMQREAQEETGRTIYDLRYQRSQPWPYSGSIMVGFTATTDDEHPTMPTDGELSETRWVTRDELLNNTLPLPGPGSLAANLIHEWLHQ